MLVVEAETNLCLQSANDAERRLVVDGYTRRGRIVVLRCGIVLSDIGRQQSLVIAVAEEEGTKHPLIGTGCRRLQGQFLAEDILAHSLTYPVGILRCKVLIDAHLIVDILIGGLAVEAEVLSDIAGVEAGCRHLTKIGTVAVIVDLACLARFRIVGGIRVASLIAVAVADIGRECPAPGRFPIESSTQETIVELINLAAVEGIAEETVIMVIAAIDGKAHTVVQLRVVIGIHHEVVVTAIACLDTSALKVEGRMGIGIDDTTNAVATIERTLRAAQHLES